MSSFGTVLRVSTFGESHGRALGVVMDGFPGNFLFSPSVVQESLERRRPGQSSVTTSRQEPDQLVIASGVQPAKQQGCLVTLGSTICMFVENVDHRPEDYQGKKQMRVVPLNDPTSPSVDATFPTGPELFATIPRPSHADLSYHLKFGVSARSGGGRSSGRETLARVAAGALCALYLRQQYAIEIVAFVSATGSVCLPEVTTFIPSVPNCVHQTALCGCTLTTAQVDASVMRCPCAVTSAKMQALAEAVRDDGDSIGSQVTCFIKNLPCGLGEPVFDKLSALLAHAMLSIPACKGFELGPGFSVVAMRGSINNDAIFSFDPSTKTCIMSSKNFNAGMQGGISNGSPVYFNVAFKPPSTISKSQRTIDTTGRPVEVQFIGRHDPVIGPRAVPVVEAMAALVVMDLLLLQQRNLLQP